MEGSVLGKGGKNMKKRGVLCEKLEGDDKKVEPTAKDKETLKQLSFLEGKIIKLPKIPKLKKNVGGGQEVKEKIKKSVRFASKDDIMKNEEGTSSAVIQVDYEEEPTEGKHLPYFVIGSIEELEHNNPFLKPPPPPEGSWNMTSVSTDKFNWKMFRRIKSHTDNVDQNQRSDEGQHFERVWRDEYAKDKEWDAWEDKAYHK